MAEPNGQSAPNGTTSNGRPSYAEKHKLPAHFIGGNRLENAPPSKVKDFVAEHDGHTVITNVSPPLPFPHTNPFVHDPSRWSRLYG